MIGGRPYGFLLVLGLLLSSFSLTQGTIPGEINSNAYSGSIIDMGRMFQQASSHSGIILNWPLMSIIIYNNPPGKPVKPLGNASGTPGTSYYYSTSAIDPERDRVQYLLDWGDGTTSTIGPVDSGAKVTASHSWSKSAKYQIRANATDSFGKSSGWSEPLTIILNNLPSRPSVPSGPSSGRPGILYNYSASAVDLDGDEIEFTFDWGDGTTSIVGPADSGAVAEASHSWIQAGTYQVKANASDSKGATSEWSKSWTLIINAPPNNPSMPFGPESVYAWSSNSYSAYAADPNEDPVKCTFDWGDGNTSTTDFIKSGSNTSAQHIWNIEGKYQIKVVAIDSGEEASGWSDSLTVTVIANNKPKVPIDIFGPRLGYIGINHSYFTLANDPDNDKVKYAFDWGDKTASMTELLDSGSVESSSHKWSKAGTYQVKCNATDSRGASSMWSKPFNVTIVDNNPPNIPLMPSGPTLGQSLTVYKYATSADDPDGNHLRYVFDWGDGTTSWTGSDFINSGTSKSVFHKWSKQGTYQVKAMAMDDKGAISGWSNALTVDIS